MPQSIGGKHLLAGGHPVLESGRRHLLLYSELEREDLLLGWNGNSFRLLVVDETLSAQTKFSGTNMPEALMGLTRESRAVSIGA